MLISVHDLNQKHNLKITGIFHIGAHECEHLIEHPNVYESYREKTKTKTIDIDFQGAKGIKKFFAQCTLSFFGSKYKRILQQFFKLLADII